MLFLFHLRQIGGTPVSSTNKTDSHDITEILLKVALNTTSRYLHARHVVRLYITIETVKKPVYTVLKHNL